MDEKVARYIEMIVAETQRPENASCILPGSPEDVVTLQAASRAHAESVGRRYVTPEDVKIAARELLRDRVLPQVATRHEDVSAAAVFERILDRVELP